MKEPSPKPPLADSPLFWMLLFGLVALAALVVVGPRYARRQGQLQQKWEARERIARQAVEQSDAKSSPAVQEAPAAGPPTLRPLFIAIALLLVIVPLVLWITRLRHPGSK
jgi:hypothetical protein